MTSERVTSKVHPLQLDFGRFHGLGHANADAD